MKQPDQARPNHPWATTSSWHMAAQCLECTVPFALVIQLSDSMTHTIHVTIIDSLSTEVTLQKRTEP